MGPYLEPKDWDVIEDRINSVLGDTISLLD